MRSKGNIAEQVAANFLLSQGLYLIDKNFYSRFGEIDLIMRLNDTLVFIEVKMRSNCGYGASQEMLTPSKQRKIIATANYYLSINSCYHSYNCRFDVIAFNGAGADTKNIEWIQNAF